MPGWTAIAAGVDWQAAGFCNEYVTAFSERRQAIGQTAVAAVAAGEDIQLATNGKLWRAQQSWLTANFTSFVNSLDYAAGFDGLADIPFYSSLSFAQFCAKAGLSASGFRRATTWPTDWTNLADPAYAFGPLTAGDIIGPWVFVDLQAAWNALVWIRRASFDSPVGISWTADGTNNYRVGLSGAAASYAAAKAAGEAAYDADGGVQHDAPPSVSGQSYKVGADFHADLYHHRARAIASSIPTHAANDVDYYAYATKGGNATYDANGEMDATEGRYHLFGSSVGNTAASAKSTAWAGDTDRPNWPASDPGSAGYSVTAGVAVVKFDVAGGFAQY